jgi:hypothetical protein
MQQSVTVLPHGLLVCDKIAGPWAQNHVSAVRTALMMSADHAFDSHVCFPPPSLSVSTWAAMADFEFCGNVTCFYFKLDPQTITTPTENRLERLLIRCS